MSRSERARRRRDQRIPMVIAGDNVVATELPGYTYEARPRAELPPKVTGVHRWVTVAAWITSVETARTAHDPDVLKFMDNENLMEFSIGCWDCEKQLGVEIAADSECEK